MIPNSYTRFSKRLHDSNFNHLTRENVFVHVIDYIIVENVMQFLTVIGQFVTAYSSPIWRA